MEVTANAIQLVNSRQNILFTETPVKGNQKCIIHREGSGLITLRGLTNQNFARFRITFGGNIAVPEDETPEPISVAVSISGEPIATSTAIISTAIVDRYFNVSSFAIVDVPKGAYSTIAVENTSPIPINVQNANLTVERIA